MLKQDKMLSVVLGLNEKTLPFYVFPPKMNKFYSLTFFIIKLC